MTQINSPPPPSPPARLECFPAPSPVCDDPSIRGSSSLPSTKTPAALRPQRPSGSAQHSPANRVQKSTKSNYRLPGHVAPKKFPVPPVGQAYRPPPNHLSTSASSSAATSLPRAPRATDNIRIKKEKVTSPSSSVIALRTPNPAIKMEEDGNEVAIKMEEGGNEVAIKMEEGGNEVTGLDKIQPAKRSIPELWETASPSVKDLIVCRHRLHQISLAAAPGGLTPPDALEAMSILEKLSTFPFEGTSFSDTKIAAAVKFVTKPEVFGDVIARRATALREKWKSGNFSPEPFLDNEDKLVDSSDEEEGEVEGGAPPRPQDLGTSLSGSVDDCVQRHLRGVIISRGKQGTKLYKLNPHYHKKAADRFGHNGLHVGDWWPFQIFALKDGAHGSRMGGIYGRTNLGAFSVVLSGGIYEENDSDSGDRVLYSGSKGGSEEDAKSEAPYTDATKSLVVSTKHNKPVRVLRSSKHNSRWSPSAGIRYDGLYNVESYSIKTDADGKKFYQFVLVRLQDQDLIDRTRPTAVEIAALDRIKEMQ